MAIALVNHAAAQTPTLSGGTGAITAAKDISGATLIVACVVANDAQTTPTDNSGSNTFIAVPTTAQTTGVFSQMYYIKNPTSTGQNNYIVTAANTNRVTAVAWAAFSGTDTASNADQSASANSAGASIQPGSITPTVDNEVVVTSYAGNSATITVTNATLTDALSFISGQAYAVAMGYVIQTTAAAVNPTWNYTTNGTVNHAEIGSFKAGAGGGAAAILRPPSFTLMGVQ